MRNLKLTKRERVTIAISLIGRAQGLLMFNRAFREPMTSGNVKAYLDTAHDLLMRADSK